MLLSRKCTIAEGYNHCILHYIIYSAVIRFGWRVSIISCATYPNEYTFAQGNDPCCLRLGTYMYVTVYISVFSYFALEWRKDLNSKLGENVEKANAVTTWRYIMIIIWRQKHFTWGKNTSQFIILFVSIYAKAIICFSIFFRGYQEFYCKKDLDDILDAGRTR